MKATLSAPYPQEIAGEFDPPPSLKAGSKLGAVRLHLGPHGRIAMKIVPGGVGIWGEDGGLLRYFHRGADLDWHPKSWDLWLFEEGMGKCSGGRGIQHILRLLNSDTLESADAREIEICVPTGDPGYLVMANSSAMCLATWLEQGSWGYVSVDLSSRRQAGPAFSFPSATVSPPAYSLDDKQIVACNLWKEGWWTDEEDYWDMPSLGGQRKLGEITVQSVETGMATRHDVIVILPPGWLPPDSDASEWQMIWGPKFVSATEFEITLPGRTFERLRLPLPATVLIPTPIVE